MAKTKGPLLSLQAHGTFNDYLTFVQKGRGTSVCKSYKPTYTLSPRQRAVRAMFKGLNELYQYSKSEIDQNFEMIAEKYDITTKNAFMKTCLEWQQQNLSPAITPTPKYTYRDIYLDIRMTDLTADSIHLNLTSFSREVYWIRQVFMLQENEVHALKENLATITTYPEIEVTIQNIKPGNYRFAQILSTKDGFADTPRAQYTPFYQFG